MLKYLILQVKITSSYIGFQKYYMPFTKTCNLPHNNDVVNKIISSAAILLISTFNI